MGPNMKNIFLAAVLFALSYSVASDEATLVPIDGVKVYRLGESIDKYRDAAEECGGLKHYSEEASYCTIYNTFDHLPSAFELLFVNDVLARIVVKPASHPSQKMISSIQSALIKQYGDRKQEYGTLTWESDGKTIAMKIRNPSAGRVLIQDDALSDQFDSFELESAEEDI
jgi:hypothetical protein